MMQRLPPLARAGLQSGSIMFVGDATAQVIGCRARGEETRVDPARCARWGCAGLLIHGPYFFAAFSRVDAYFGAAVNVASVLKKTTAAQFIVFPPYLGLLFTYMGVAEQQEDVASYALARSQSAFLAGCVFWPVVNTFNFAIVPATLRVPYLAGVGVAWNSYLSWMNARKAAEEAQQAARDAPKVVE